MTKVIKLGLGINNPPKTPEQAAALKKALEFEANMILSKARRGEWNPAEETMTYRGGSHDTRYMGRNSGWYKTGTVFEDEECVIQIDDALTECL